MSVISLNDLSLELARPDFFSVKSIDDDRFVSRPPINSINQCNVSIILGYLYLYGIKVTV